MRRENMSTLSIIHQNGASTRVEISVEEYAKVIECRQRITVNSRDRDVSYCGVGINGLPYRLTLGDSTFCILLDGGEALKDELLVTVVNAKGLTASLFMNRAEYGKIMDQLADGNNRHYYGTTANGQPFQIALPLDTVSVSAKPMNLHEEEPLGR